MSISQAKKLLELPKHYAGATQIQPPFRGYALAHAVDDSSTIAHALHKASQTHSSQMVRDPGRGQFGYSRNLTHSTLTADQSADEFYAVWITQRFHCLGAFEGVKTHPVLRCGCGHRWSTACLLLFPSIPTGLSSRHLWEALCCLSVVRQELMYLPVREM